MAAKEVMTEKEFSKANQNGSDVEIQSVRFDDNDLRNIQSFDDALKLLADEGHVVAHADQELGNGFSILNDKSNLCGVEMLLLSWNFNQGDMGEFVSVSLVARMPGTNVPAKLVVNDGGTGIYKDLRTYTDRTGKTAGLHIKRGFRRSDYTKVIDGKETGATTYYLDTSA